MRLGSFCAMLIALGVALTPVTVFAEQAKSDNAVPMPPANWLFVQTGQSFTSDGAILTIHGVNPQTLMFTDRPERMTGDASTEKFMSFWTEGKDDFQKDPPNATLSTGGADAEIAVVELTNPRLSGSDLTYDIKALSGAVPASGDAVSLFIDWWYGPGRPGWVHGDPYAGGRCWVGYNGFLHCHPGWSY